MKRAILGRFVGYGIILIAAFGYGAVVGNYKVFPYEQLSAIKQTIAPHKNTLLRNGEAHRISVFEEFSPNVDVAVLNSPRWLYVVTDEIFSNYTKIVEQLESKGINIFIQSTIQCVVDKCGSEKVRRVNELNQRLRAYAENSKSTFIDLGVLSDANGLDDSLSSDGVHLNGMGYRKWVDAIFPTVMKLGGK